MGSSFFPIPSNTGTTGVYVPVTNDFFMKISIRPKNLLSWEGIAFIARSYISFYDYTAEIVKTHDEKYHLRTFNLVQNWWASFQLTPAYKKLPDNKSK